MFKTSTGELLHHSFIIPGGEGSLDKIRKDLGDCIINTYIEDSLEVDTVREIISNSDMVSQGGLNAYLIYFNEATFYSQNALLKALEEPKDNTVFILVTRNTSKLLDTIHSRCFYISLKKEEAVSVDEFISLLMKDRIKYVEKMAKDYKDGKVSRLDIINLMSGCIEKKKSDVDICRRLVDIQKLMNSSSAAVKQVLESFAICLE